MRRWTLAAVWMAAVLGGPVWTWGAAWIPLPPICPGRPGLALCDMGVDTRGGPWALTNHGLFWWDGAAWREVRDGQKPLGGGLYVTSFAGGADRGLYLTQPGADEHHGSLWRLESGRACRVSDVYFDSSGTVGAVFVDISGRVFNLGRRFLAVLIDGKWQRTETVLGDLSGISVAEFAPDVGVLFIPRTGESATWWDGKTIRPGLPLPNLPNAGRWDTLRAVAWGRDKVLFWRLEQPGFVAARLVGGKFQTEPIPALAERLGTTGSIAGARAAPHGAVWLAWRKGPGGDYIPACLASHGGLSGLDLAGTAVLTDNRSQHFPAAFAFGPDGGAWAGLQDGRIARLTETRSQIFDWRTGAEGLGNVTWIRPGPGGPGSRVFAGSVSSARVFRLDPAVSPRPDMARQWEEVMTASFGLAPVDDFSGRMWMFRADRSRLVSAWDGHAWQDRPAPFDAHKGGYLAVDDRGNLVVTMQDSTEGVYVVGPAGTKHFSDPRAAFLHCVKDGATRFRSRVFVGPVLHNGALWFGYLGHPIVSVCRDGRWEDMEVGSLEAMAPDKDGRMVFLTESRAWVYDRGQLTALPIAPAQGPRFCLVGRRFRDLPFCPALPEAIRSQYLPMVIRGNYFHAIAAEDIPQIGTASAEGIRTCQPPLPGTPWAVPDATGGAWVCTHTYQPHRLFESSLVPIAGEGTPLAGGRDWMGITLLPSGGVCVASCARADGGIAGLVMMLRKAGCPPPPAPAVASVTRTARAARVEWNSPHVLWRAAAGQPWQPALNSRCDVPLPQVSCESAAIEVRTMDGVGMLGNPAPLTVKVPLVPWLRRRIADLRDACDELARQEALADLKLVPLLARELLEETLRGKDGDDPHLRRALAELTAGTPGR